MPSDRENINIIYIFINRLGKRLVSIPYNKTIDARIIAQFYLVYIYKYYSLVTIIVSNRSPQFISAF
jgi:hypothetical protein